MGYIYSITNNRNSKRYIGQTINLQSRWNAHINDLSNNKHHSHKLQNAWNKNKLDFQFEVIEEISDCLLDEREKYWIMFYDSYNNGYNETLGGDGCGHETLEKKVYCYDFDGNYLNICFRSTREASRQLKIDQSLIFNICNNTRNKKSATSPIDQKVYRFSYKLQDKLPKIVYNKQRQIIQLDLNDNIIQEWNSIADANEAICGNRQSTKISKALKTGKVCQGYKWKYKYTEA